MMTDPSIHLVDDVLREIFHVLRDAGHDEQWLSRWVTVGALVSQVSSQWRSIALSDSSLWTDVSIGPSSSPRMARSVLDRAVEHNLRVSFRVPNDIDLLFEEFSAPFKASIHLVVAQSTKWESLSVISPYCPLRHILKMCNTLPLPKLHSLELIRSDTAATLRCGPFTELNPMTFRHLVLDGVAIRPADSFQFSGIQSLTIANTDLRMLDGIHMKFLTSSAFPTEFTPLLMNMKYLNIRALLLPQIPRTLAFNPSTLVSLKLSGLSADNFPPYGAPVSLVPKLLTASLRSLELTDIHSTAVKILFSSLHGRIFGGLQRLRIVSTDLRLGGLESELEKSLQSIFPSLIEFSQV